MTAVMTAQKVDGRTLVEPTLFDRLVRRVMTDESADRDHAERVVDQSLAFLGACAVSTERLVPSVQVDPGWHAFVLHTQDYAAFCDRLAGRFLHHEPTDPNAERTEDTGDEDAIARTISAITAAGYRVDRELWAGAGAKCGETGCGAGRPPVTNVA